MNNIEYSSDANAQARKLCYSDLVVQLDRLLTEGADPNLCIECVCSMPQETTKCQKAENSW
jgi:hypothetical protein